MKLNHSMKLLWFKKWRQWNCIKKFHNLNRNWDFAPNLTSMSTQVFLHNFDMNCVFEESCHRKEYYHKLQLNWKPTGLGQIMDESLLWLQLNFVIQFLFILQCTWRADQFERYKNLKCKCINDTATTLHVEKYKAKR